MRVSPSNGTNPIFHATNTLTEPLSDLAILRQVMPNDCSVDNKMDLQQQKRSIIDKLIAQRPVDAELDLSRSELNELDLNGVNLQSANLERAQLQKTNLDQACLSGANLQSANLERAQLQKANLDKVCLSDANLQIANLKEAMLEYAKLDNANLDYTTLNNAKLHKASLCNASLYRTKLIKADLSSADLDIARLFEAELHEASLENASLINADLQQVKFVATKMQRANFSYSKLQYSVFIEADLTEANLINTNLSFTNFTDAKLNDANFIGANLNGANLTGANIEGANLCDIYLPDWNNDYLDIYLNHNNNNSSLLTTIDSIDEKYSDIKINLVHQLIKSLDKRPADLSLAPVIEPLLTTLTKAAYNQDMTITNWLNNNLLLPYLVKYETTQMPAPGEQLLVTLLTCFANKPALMFSHNGAFIQLISPTMAGDSSHKEQAEILYNCYLQDSRVAAYTGGDFGDYNGNPDWSDKDANNLILLSNQQNSPYAMMMSQNQLQRMLDLKAIQEGINWHGFYVYQGQENTGSAAYQLDVLFRQHFKIFANSYLFSQQQANFSKLLVTLDLGDELHAKFEAATKLTAIKTAAQEIADAKLREVNLAEVRLAETTGAEINIAKARLTEAKKELAEALTKVQLSSLTEHKEDDKNKLVSVNCQRKLETIFDDKFKEYTENNVIGYRLTDEYRQQLLAAYQLTNADATTQAETLLSLAAVFSKYSSSAIFGTETLSPYALRYFAFALMEQAHQLAPQTFKDEKQYKDWTDRLLGYNGAFSCTAVLSGMMVEHIKQHFPDTLAGIMPPAWS